MEDLKALEWNPFIKIHKEVSVLQEFSGEVQHILHTLKSVSVAQPAGFLNAYHCGLLHPSVSQLPDKVSCSIHFWALMLLRTNELSIMGVPQTVRGFLLLSLHGLDVGGK